MAKPRKLVISLLHATWHREESPVHLKRIWLDNAEEPRLVDYVFALDVDDSGSVSRTRGHLRIVGGQSVDGRPTSVRNWNAAAQVASGHLLFVIADDLYPPPRWDAMIRDTLMRLDPCRQEFAVKITDSNVTGDCLLRHPIVSRAYYENQGLFDPRFRSLHCDSDLTLNAFWRTGILDGRGICFEHRHPAVDPRVRWTVSQDAGNRGDEYELSRTTFMEKWSRLQRLATLRPIPTSVGRTTLPYGKLVANALGISGIPRRAIRGASGKTHARLPPSIS